MKDAFVIAKYAPGVGNPLSLSIDEFNDYLSAIAEFFKQQNEGATQAGTTDHRSFVEQQMRTLGYGSDS